MECPLRSRRRGRTGRATAAAPALLASALVFSGLPARALAQAPPEPPPEAAPRRELAPSPPPQGESLEPAAGAGEGGVAPRNWGNLRIGGSTGNRNGKPEVCGELSPVRFVTIEGCGTGAGIWHHDPSPETAHFRANLRLASLSFGRVWLEPRVGAGFAEMAIAADDAGFQFTSAGPRKVETAGPEAATSLQVVYPLAGGFEAVGNVTVGAAYLAHAPELQLPQAKFQPFFGASLGAGF